MAIRRNPRPGMVYVCDFSGYNEPEIVKTRRVVVVSTHRHELALEDITVIVVPLSTTEPIPMRAWHYLIEADKYDGIARCWAKGDLPAHVRLARLDRLFYRGRYIVPQLDAADLAAVRRTLGHAVGLPIR